MSTFFFESHTRTHHTYCACVLVGPALPRTASARMSADNITDTHTDTKPLVLHACGTIIRSQFLMLVRRNNVPSQLITMRAWRYYLSNRAAQCNKCGVTASGIVGENLSRADQICGTFGKHADQIPRCEASRGSCGS